MASPSGSGVAAGVRLCLGSDWGPSGTRNVLWELKVADLWNKTESVFTDEELVRMVTSNPGAALSGVWPRPVGKLEPGALADLVVVRRSAAGTYRSVIEATESDIRLVVVGGRARYGLRSLMTPLAPAATSIKVGRLSRAIDYGDPAVTWKTVVADLEKIRSDPAGASARAAVTFAAFIGDGVAGNGLADSFVLLPDMPAPEVDDEILRGGPATPSPDPVTIPPLEPLTTSTAWFDTVDANPFHNGLLSGLRAYA
ncbi:amidohydrolase family protein [Kribbella sp. C-35]|uniref:amidohydrolase family protein n=1 Tax=Kribbella sp. C-35 TaxID=2789276 RepID=UPI00397A0598